MSAVWKKKVEELEPRSWKKYTGKAGLLWDHMRVDGSKSESFDANNLIKPGESLDSSIVTFCLRAGQAMYDVIHAAVYAKILKRPIIQQNRHIGSEDYNAAKKALLRLYL